MKRDDLVHAIGEIDDDLILQADAPPKKTNAFRGWKRWGTVAACFVLLFAILFPLGIRLARRNAVGERLTYDLMEGIVPRQRSGIPAPITNDAATAATDFAVRLFRTASDGADNALLSPLSVLSALAMLTNGARDETLAQIETAVGMTVGEMNDFFLSYLAGLSRGEKSELTLSDSIWFRSDGSIEIDPAFLQTNADVYGADAYGAPFDEGTLRKINEWVNEKTDGMIPSLLDEISRNAVLYLINALSFDAEWKQHFESDYVRTGDFKTGSGEIVTVSYMQEINFHGTGTYYLADERAVGMYKYYDGEQYAFVALLPNEGISVSDYLASLDGGKLRSLLSQKQQPAELRVKIPKFEIKYETELAGALAQMGMTDVFDSERADLSGIGRSPFGNLYLDCVIHKTFIAVNEKGTRAGATSALGIYGATADAELKEVYLTRPFVYMLIDCNAGLPLFIGTLNDPTK